MTPNIEITDPSALLAALDIGEPARPESPEIERFVRRALDDADRRRLLAARRMLGFARSTALVLGTSTKRLDVLLDAVRTALRAKGHK